MSSPYASNIQIRAEVDQQDIHVCLFTVDRPVHSGAASFTSADEAQANDLAKRLFNIPGISRVELDGYKVTVTQTGDEDWRQIGKRIGSAIRTFLNPPPEVPEGDRLPPEEVRRRVQQVLDEMINPGVASHGGFVELLDVQDDDVFIRMGGGCQGCGAADMTLKMGIERLIRENVPQVREILDTTDHASGRNPYYAAAK
ncbi:MAG TPA: NifU family protein [Blastocatellia bacterium]|nr:NifU family protein [Blastocatellia bacterium]